jgi:hypothetical protein
MGASGVDPLLIAANKKRAYAAMVDMSANGATIADEMRETNCIALKSHLDLKKEQHCSRISASSQRNKSPESAHPVGSASWKI